MIFIFLLIYIYKLFFPRQINLIPRDNLPRICVYINSNDYNEILKVLSLQTYPNSLYDVYINTDDKYNYKFNVYKYNRDQIRNTKYNLITIINDIVDLNYLHQTSKSYLEGYDIIFGSTQHNISLLLIKRTINQIINNSIYEDCFSFNIELFNNNVINLNNILILKKFLMKKTSLICFNPDIKNIGTKNEYNSKLIVINPLDKRFFYLKVYGFLISTIIVIISGNFFLLLSSTYIMICISNILFLYKYHRIRLLPVILLPLNLIHYFINYLLFRINNKRSNIKSI